MKKLLLTLLIMNSTIACPDKPKIIKQDGVTYICVIADEPEKTVFDYFVGIAAMGGLAYLTVKMLDCAMPASTIINHSGKFHITYYGD
jgi:ABC-type microcin C transport system permease subunit YejE